MTAVSELIHSELGVNVVVTKCLRLGKPGSRPQLLLASLADDKQATEVLRLAKMLRHSLSEHIRTSVFINADLTHQQRTSLFNARMEIKRRRAAGETDLLVRDGRVIKKSATRATQSVVGVVSTDSS
jgi:hypothetical protein